MRITNITEEGSVCLSLAHSYLIIYLFIYFLNKPQAGGEQLS